MSDDRLKKTNEQFIKNIRFWLGQCNKSIGEFEINELKMSRGYISRLEKSPNLFPELDVLIRVAQIMDITIDFLINEDFSTIGDNTKLIHDLISKLRNDTISGKIEWKTEGGSYIFYDGAEYKRENVNSEYKAYASMSPFYAEYANGQVICLQPFQLKGKSKNRKTIRKLGYELYIEEGSSKKNTNKILICYSDTVIDTIAHELHELALIIDQKLNDIKLDDKATKAINNILNMS